MNLKSGKLILALLLLLLGAAALFFCNGIESGKRLYINSIVLNFNSVKSSKEAAEKFAPGSAMSKVVGPNSTRIVDATQIVYGQQGEVVVLSDKYDLVIVLTPTSNAAKPWSCFTYPKISFNSLCDGQSGGSQ